MKYIVFVIIYLVIDILCCYVVNLHVGKWLLTRAYDKWGVSKYHNMTYKQKEWFENRQTIYETWWDMIISVALVIILINVFKLNIQ